MVCGSCGTSNPPNRKFCGECGARLAVACTTCGAAIEAGQKFCGECGTPVAGAARPSEPPAVPAAMTVPSAPAPVAERRLVSVLFADLVGFTPFSEERDSEEVRDVLTRYFDLASVVVGRYGGTIEKFIGDAVMAVWGTPTAREDDAERAVRAAIELLDAVRTLDGGLAARAGVLTGEAAVTIGAANQGMVAGDLVNTASRLQSAAAAGTVLVGEATYRASAAAIAFEPAGEHSLKGKASPIPAWRALRVVAERGGRGRADLLEAPFVGRDEELRLLKELFHATSREGRARLVSVTGPAGIGKSRLAWEFEKYLDGLVEPVWWHHGRSPAYGQGITFWALGEMVRSRCGLEEGSDEATTRAGVSEMLRRNVPDAAERAWIEPALLALLGVQATAVAADELFARWRLLFERLAATGTVVMVFEDLHWADPGTLDFIDHLLDWSKSIPLLIVTLARPELLAQRPDFGAGRRSFASIALEPLSEAAVRALLAGLVPDLPEEAVRRIVARAEGIPLYAVETVRMLLADKRLALRDGVYTVAGDIASLAVPETLTALIAARLDGLDAVDRSLVLDAAVLGQRFTVDALAAVSGLDAATLEPRLRGLVRRELLTLEADPRSPERGQYGFVQALIREVAYNTLAHRDRKERHLAAARHFEATGSDELAGALARHYLAAHENATEGAEAEALAAQARIALRAAAERSGALGSHGQAADLLAQAIAITQDPAERADLQERLGREALWAARFGASLSAFEAAFHFHAERGARVDAARLTGLLGESLISAGRVEEGHAILEEGAREYADLGATGEMAVLRSQLARSAFRLGDNRAAVALADEVLEVAEQEGDVPVLSDTLITKGTALVNMGRGREGVALLELGTQIAEADDLIRTQLRGLINLSVSTSETDPAAALESCTRGLALARRLGSGETTPSFVGNLSFLALRTGDWDLAASELLAAADERWGGGDGALVLNNLWGVLVLRGEDASRVQADLEAMAGDLDEAFYLSARFDSLAVAALAAGDFSEAARQWREAGRVYPPNAASMGLQAARAALWAGDTQSARADLELIDALRLPYAASVANRRSLRAGIDWLEGRRDGAVAALAAARRQLLGIGLRWDASQAALDAGFTVGAGDPTVREALLEARDFLTGAQARPIVAIVDRLLEHHGAASDDGEPVDTAGTAPAPSPAPA
jgi:class 3 adenylate cyclase